MNTSAGSPVPYTRYCTCTPSGAMAMRAAPGAGSAGSFAGGSGGDGRRRFLFAAGDEDEGSATAPSDEFVACGRL